MGRKIIYILLSGVLLSAPFSVYSVDSVPELLSLKEAPTGIVFEIVSGNRDLLQSILPEVRDDIERIRQRFPGIVIAIVTHGAEQFALTKKNRSKNANVHKLVQELVSRKDVDIHVCGTYAEWYGVSPEDFPDYVDVAPAGPTQINNYEELGYVVITLP